MILPGQECPVALDLDVTQELGAGEAVHLAGYFGILGAHTGIDEDVALRRLDQQGVQPQPDPVFTVWLGFFLPDDTRNLAKDRASVQ